MTSNCAVPLAEGYKKHFRTQYKSDKAIRQIMQLPVVVFRLREKLFVTEFRSDMNYDKFVQFINMLVPESVLSKGLSKESLKLLCDLTHIHSGGSGAGILVHPTGSQSSPVGHRYWPQNAPLCMCVRLTGHYV